MAGSVNRILVVEDDPELRTALSALFRREGYEVFATEDGVQAFTRAIKDVPGLVLLDLGMPRLNGYDACRRIREKPWGKDIFLIALTGWGQDDDRRRTEAAGFNCHMVKPINPRDLMKVLAQLQATAE